MNHKIRKYNGGTEICCMYEKEKKGSYGTIYFERDVGKNYICRVCGKKLGE